MKCAEFEEIIDKIKMEALESFLVLCSVDEELSKKYGIYIEEYYKLPAENQMNVCKSVYKNYTKEGTFSIDTICTLIVYEVENMEEKVDPVIAAIRESHELMKQNPVINVDGVRIEDTNCIKKNIKRMSERPNIDFSGCRDE